jgi:hypothetical protein
VPSRSRPAGVASRLRRRYTDAVKPQRSSKVTQVCRKDTVDGDPARLQLGSLGPDKQPFLKHFLHLDGLGIRDLCVHGDDLLILAGPTMDLDGPVAIFRWLGGAHPAGNGLVLREACPIVGAVPFGQGADKGTDHAEGMCLCSADGWEGPAVLVVYDAASPSRLAHAEGAVSADIFALP